MKLRTAAALGLLTLTGCQTAPRERHVAIAEPAPLATPAGITLQDAKAANPLGESPGMIFATPAGRTLYTYDADTTPGVSTCTADCAKAWPAALAPAHAAPFGPWTLVARDDGSKQWAFKGKPLYAFAEDTAAGEIKGNGGGNGAWHAAWFRPAGDAIAPSGVMVREVVDAPGQVFADYRGMTLYVRSAAQVIEDGAHWVPLAAPNLANAVGDFTVTRRDDGTRQWAYKGKLLYTFGGDRQPGDANGNGVDGFTVAMLARYFMPPGVVIGRALGVGTILASADGMTLYKRDGYRFAVGTHNTRAEARGVPAMGRAIGTNGCDAACTAMWRPLVAAPGAEPSGFWEIALRDDGTRQWAYRGYPLYLYSGDRKPGDALGHDVYDLLIRDNAVRQVAEFRPNGTTGISPPQSMNWTVVLP